MGFEIKYRFNEREDGDYSEEIKENTYKVGDIYEDTPLEKLVSALMQQLARRDIWIIDWEIFEFKRSKISCKETKGGFIIKNKKFSLDGAIITAQDIAPEIPIQQPIQGVPSQIVAEHPHNVIGPRRAVKMVMLDDAEDENYFKFKQKGLKFTANKEYPVFQEKPGATFGDSIYEMQDDLGRDVSVNSIYFIPSRVKLIEGQGDASFQQPKREPGPKLLYDNAVVDDIPDLNQIKRGGPKAIAAARKAISAQKNKPNIRESDIGQPTGMINLEHVRSTQRDDLSGVDSDMALIASRAEARSNQKLGKKVIRKPVDEIELPMEDEVL